MNGCNQKLHPSLLSDRQLTVGLDFLLSHLLIDSISTIQTIKAYTGHKHHTHIFTNKTHIVGRIDLHIHKHSNTYLGYDVIHGLFPLGTDCVSERLTHAGGFSKLTLHGDFVVDDVVVAVVGFAAAAAAWFHILGVLGAVFV